MFDLVVHNGRVLDGTGAPGFFRDIAIRGDRIVAIGKLSGAEAHRAIEAEGLVVAPGFIDIHSHADTSIFLEPRAESALSQGVTTVLGGNCGMGAAPLPSPDSPGYEEARQGFQRVHGMELPWQSFAGYLDALEGRGIAINVGSLVGHGTIRKLVMGRADRPCTPAELEAMKGLLAQALEEGALGFSTGLEYIPGISADREELVELCRVVARYDRLYATHMRQRDWKAVESTREALQTAEAAGVRLQVSHLTPRRWRPHGALEEMIEMLDGAEARGIEAHWDCVTSPWGGGGPYSLIARWALEGSVEEVRQRLSRPEVREAARRWVGIPAVKSPQLKCLLSDEWDQVYLDYCRASPQYIGMSLAQIGVAQGEEPQDALFDLLIAEGENLAEVSFKTPLHTIEDDIRLNIAHPKCTPISDAEISATSGPMAGKRAYYAWAWLARVLANYVREERLLTLPEAVRKLTSYPAWVLGLKDRGLLREGMKADIAIFDPEAVEPTMAPLGANAPSRGFAYAIVNGKVAFEAGQVTPARAGEVIRA